MYEGMVVWRVPAQVLHATNAGNTATSTRRSYRINGMELACQVPTSAKMAYKTSVAAGIISAQNSTGSI
jgi:hypothetical protein